MGKKGGRRKRGGRCGRRREEVGSWWWKWRASGVGRGRAERIPARPATCLPTLSAPRRFPVFERSLENSRTQFLSAGDVRRSRHRYDTHRTTERRAIKRSGNVPEVTCRVVSLRHRVPCPVPFPCPRVRHTPPPKTSTRPRCTTTAGNHTRRRTPPVRNATACLSYGSAGNQRAAVPRVPVKDTNPCVIGDAADFSARTVQLRSRVRATGCDSFLAASSRDIGRGFQ